MARKRKIEQSAAKLGFEQELLETAEEMWGHISAAEYRQILTGLIFLRYVSATFDRRYGELKKEGLEEYRDGYAEENVFFIPQESRWGVIASAAHSPEIGVVLDRALEAVERENPPLKGILPKVYASPGAHADARDSVAEEVQVPARGLGRRHGNHPQAMRGLDGQRTVIIRNSLNHHRKR